MLGKTIIPCLFIATALGCASMSSYAPDLPANIPAGMDAASVARGRNLYITDCTRCHSPVPVTELDQDQWDDLLPRMVRMTHLDSMAHEDLAAYIRVVAQPQR